jgi:hypothetical protein
MNRNQLFILLGIALVLGAIAVVAWVAIQALAPKEGAQTETQTLAPSDPFGSITVPGSIASESRLSLVTTAGDTLSVPDFTKGKEPIAFAGESYYFLYGPEYSSEGFAYSVQYHTTDSSFLIELLAEPLGESRDKAKEYLRELLKVPAASLCDIRVRVVVSAAMNQQFAASENLGLSGCPGSVELP